MTKKTHLDQHSRTNTKEFFFNFCDKNYTSKENLNKHLKIHKKLTLYNCDVCLKVFLSQKYLKRHYKCLLKKNILLVNLVTKNLLKQLFRHQATNSGVRSFSC